MAMRITTKMMQNTSLRNLNTNKSRQEKLTNQLATGKKIMRPSDDPIIAIRSLKLNGSLDRIEQYFENNSEDAEKWLSLTASAIDTSAGIITSMSTEFTQVSNGLEQAKDRLAIMENLKNYKKELYATGNADYSGRSLFTGYRTDQPLTFREDKTEKYTITEQITNAGIDTMTFVKTGDLTGLNKGNFKDQKYLSEYDVNDYEVARIRLAYDNVDVTAKDNSGNYEANVKLGYLSDSGQYLPGYATINLIDDNGSKTKQTIAIDEKGICFDTNANPRTYYTIDELKENAKPLGAAHKAYINEDGKLQIIDTGATKPEDCEHSYTIGFSQNEDGTYVFDDKYMTSLKIDKVCAKAEDSVYESVLGDTNKNQITYVAETGELLLGSAIKKELTELPNDAEIRVTYDKKNWAEGDLDPVHYFYAERYENGENEKPLIYNDFKLDWTDEADHVQIIEYDIGNNQSIRVNTTADELYTHDIGRDVDDVLGMIEAYDKLENTKTELEKLRDSGVYTGDDLTKLEEQIASLGKAITLTKEKAQRKCEELQTTFKGYLQQNSLAETRCGSRESRLKLIQNRLSIQKTNFEELVSTNEDADYTDLAIQLKSVEMTYEAALTSISYVMKTSLLQFI
ncbi:MAG: hypothetical protein II312_07700 [Lachnospiraceae bacterium]|nr:hypothetical protein [Lachnospiraceae bacterium]